MFNWSEIEEVYRMRLAEMAESFSDADVAHLDAINEDAASRPLRSRLAAVLVRIGARLDPEAVAHSGPFVDHEVLAEGRLAYLR